MPLHLSTNLIAAGVTFACRHAWASHAHEAGMPLIDIQEQLGHSDIKTTAAYLHSNPRQRARSVEMASWTTPTPQAPDLAPTAPPPVVPPPAPPEPSVAPVAPPAVPAPEPPRKNKEHRIRTIRRSS